jgi:hypothetical protein
MTQRETLAFVDVALPANFLSDAKSNDTTGQQTYKHAETL